MILKSNKLPVFFVILFIQVFQFLSKNSVVSILLGTIYVPQVLNVGVLELHAEFFCNFYVAIDPRSFQILPMFVLCLILIRLANVSALLVFSKEPISGFVYLASFSVSLFQPLSLLIPSSQLTWLLFLSLYDEHFVPLIVLSFFFKN